MTFRKIISATLIFSIFFTFATQNSHALTLTYDKTITSPHFRLYFENQDEDISTEITKILEDIFQKEVIDLGFKNPIKNDEKMMIFLISDILAACRTANAVGCFTKMKTASGSAPIIFVNRAVRGLKSKNWTYNDKIGALIRVTLAHEFFHAIQQEYGDTFSHNAINFVESTAVWMEDYVFAQGDDYINYLTTFFQKPENSIFNPNTGNNLFPYASAIWLKYLTEKFGTPIFKTIWENYLALDQCKTQKTKICETGIPENDVVRTFRATDAALVAKNTTTAKIFPDFALWNLNRKLVYGEGYKYPDITPIATYTTFPVVKSTVPARYPAAFGTTYIKFDFQTRATRSDLTVTFSGANTTEWTVRLVTNSRRNVQKVRNINLTKNSGEVDLKSVEQYENAFLIITPIRGAVDEGHFYEYSITKPENATLAKVLLKKSDIPQPRQVKITPKNKTLAKISPSFTDVTQNHPFFTEIEFMKSQKLWNGFLDGTFRPDQPVTRAEIAKLITNGHKLDTKIQNSKCFPDVEISAWFSPFICALRTAKLTNGYSDGKYKPFRHVTRAEALKIIGIKPNYTKIDITPPDTGTFWYSPYISSAVLDNIIDPDTHFRPTDPITRGEIAEMWYRYSKK